jgi:hypothetical protein
MRWLRLPALCGLLGVLALVPSAEEASAALINEVRIDNSGADSDEYFELSGEAGESLDGLTYLVIGDGAAGSGVIENVTDLSGLSLEADGLLAVHKDGTTATCTGYDVELTLNFENSDNVTHLLVSGFSGANGDDLDTDDDSVLDSTPWTSVVDCVALIETVESGDHVYCDVQVGPDGAFVPGQVFHCTNGWNIGAFADLCIVDTPGEANDCSVPVKESTWGKVKSLYQE